MKKKYSMKLIILFSIYVFLSAGGLILFKLGSKNLQIHLSNSDFSVSGNWFIILGILFYLCSFILWLVIVNMTKLSLALPISVGIVNVLVLVGSALVLQEVISVVQWIGAAVIIIGILILSFGGKI